MQRVRIIKSHVGLGRVLEVGEELDLSDTMAHDKIRSGKAVRVVPKAPEAASVPSSAPADAAPAAPSGDSGAQLPAADEGQPADQTRTTEGSAETQDPPSGQKGKGKKGK